MIDEALGGCVTALSFKLSLIYVTLCYIFALTLCLNLTCICDKIMNHRYMKPTNVMQSNQHYNAWLASKDNGYLF